MSKGKMEIDNIVNNWFEETVAQMNADNKPNEPVDNLCSGVVPLAHNYCNSTLLLLNNNKILPSMALLRVLAELAFRFIWCLYKDNPKNQATNVRIERWIKETYQQNVILLKKFLPSASSEGAQNIKREIEFLEKAIRAIPHTSAGPFYNSLNELPPLYKEALYPRLYGNFNRAIHPDLKLLADLTKQEGNKRLFLSDLNEVDIQSLKIFCMTAAFTILSIVRLHYDWNYKGLKSEYLKIKRKYAKEI